MNATIGNSSYILLLLISKHFALSDAKFYNSQTQIICQSCFTKLIKNFKALNLLLSCSMHLKVFSHCKSTNNEILYFCISSPVLFYVDKSRSVDFHKYSDEFFGYLCMSYLNLLTTADCHLRHGCQLMYQDCNFD